MKHREFSLLSMLLIGASAIALIVAVCVDVDALLQYFVVVSDSSVETLELGSALSAGAVVPFLAAGMSISADLYRKERLRMMNEGGGR